MESRPGCGDDVAVRLGLGQIHCLLFLQDEEAVELGGGLFPVVVSAKLQQADGLGSGLRHHTLKNTRSDLKTRRRTTESSKTLQLETRRRPVTSQAWFRFPLLGQKGAFTPVDPFAKSLNQGGFHTDQN